ncbi:BrnT family toxin [Peredibacter sp. HCB2-198]|uniref:BrnT family toxin n=1 Tax=Peredibacter sp. HCB2-198 TaxID=3383025 RepID=UPI0038B4FD6B
MLYSDEVAFIWDDIKAAQNLKKHRVSFIEAVTVWSDPNSLEIPDPDHSTYEERWIRLGYSQRTRVLVVVFCELKDETIRIISSRRATTNEKRQYDERRV